MIRTLHSERPYTQTEVEEAYKTLLQAEGIIRDLSCSCESSDLQSVLETNVKLRGVIRMVYREMRAGLFFPPQEANAK